MSEKPFYINRNLIDKLWERFNELFLKCREENLNKNNGVQNYDSIICSSLPSKEHLETLINYSFWASLQKEEGRQIKFSLVYGPFESKVEPFIFNEPLAFDQNTLVKLAPALKSNLEIVTYINNDNSLEIWGFADPYLDLFRVKVIEAATLMISYLGIKVLLTGTRIEFVTSDRLFMPNVSNSIPSNDPIDALNKKCSYLLLFAAFYIIAKEIRSQGHGGTLLIVPNKKDEWKQSIKFPVSYLLKTPYEKPKRSLQNIDNEWTKSGAGFKNPAYLVSDEYRVLQKNLNELLEVIGKLASVDGAVLISYDLELLAFGAKIKPINSDNCPESISIFEPFEHRVAKNISLKEIGGTRHQSTAQFIFDQQEALAFVVSQDNKISAFSWDTTQNKVVVTTNIELFFE